MEEKKLFLEVPGGKNKFHSAILTSFSFNFHHFEYQVLKTLKKKWITNIGVLVDSDMLDRTIGLASGGLRQLTRTYSINSIKSKGAFHSKINFFIGDKGLLMVMGSGNISSGGHGKNHETFTAFYADSESSPILPLLLESWNYLKSVSLSLEGYSKDRIFRVIPNNCSLLKNLNIIKHQFRKIDNNTEVAFVYNDNSSIFNQISLLIPTNDIDLITIICPYFDMDGKLLLMLLNKFLKTKIHIYLSQENGLPPTSMDENNRISFYSWDSTQRGKMKINGNENYNRKLHSKIFNFKSLKEEYCLIGSPNATVAAFGDDNNRGINEEFAALYKSSKLDFLKILGITSSKGKISLSNLSRDKNIVFEENKNNRKKFKFRISSCDINGLTLKLFLSKSLDKKDLILKVFNDIGVEIFMKSNLPADQNMILIKLTSDCLNLNPAYISIVDTNDNFWCNKEVINYLDNLYRTDPSKSNRTISGLIGDLEIGKINEIQILNYLTELKVGDYEKISTKITPGSKSKESVSNVNGEMTFGQAIEASKKIDLHEKLVQVHNTFRIWETLNHLFKSRKQSQLEDMNDEEEDGQANIGKERKPLEKIDKPIEIKNKNIANRILDRTKRLSNNLINKLNKSKYDKELKINEVVLIQFLLVSHVITFFHYFKEYNLPMNDKKDKYMGYSPKEWKAVLRNSYHTIMQNMILALAKFILLHDVQTYEDDLRQSKLDDSKMKVLSIIILYNYLINGKKLENSHSQLTDLACLNIFQKLGTPDENFSNNLELVPEKLNGDKFSIKNVIQLKNRLVGLQEKIYQKDQYFLDEAYGVCYIKELNSSQVIFKSILNPHELNRYSLKKFKKIMR